MRANACNSVGSVVDALAQFSRRLFDGLRRRIGLLGLALLVRVRARVTAGAKARARARARARVGVRVRVRARARVGVRVLGLVRSSMFPRAFMSRSRKATLDWWPRQPDCMAMHESSLRLLR